jgi:uncharacterized protein YndB with AHSA1/START domain
MSSRVLVSLRVRGTTARAFEVFTSQIGEWWRPNSLFQFTRSGPGILAFEPGVGGRFTETLRDGRIFEIGRITAWEPGAKLGFTWRQESFSSDQITYVEVRFEAIGDETRVTVEHRGWDSIPPEHVARHGFPDGIFLQRHGERWQMLLESCRMTIK